MLITVTDDGPGMDEETLGRIFEPFFTTKPVGEGTGLGLASVYGVVTQCGGAIEVDSALGAGAEFAIRLPACSAEDGFSTASAGRAAPADGSETVLVVEDEPLVRRLAQRVLRSRGYTVLIAGDGREGVRVAEEHEGPIHVLLTDMVMPRMNGIELARAIAASRPDTKILFMSGYARSDEMRRAPRDMGAGFLAKPFSPELLSDALREILDHG